MIRRYRSAVILCALLALIIVCPAYPLQVTKQLAPGVSLYQEIETDAARAQIINMVTIDLKQGGAGVKAALGKDVVYTADSTKGRETISLLTARRGAIVGVNADFFPWTGDPLGINIIDGRLVSEPNGSFAAFGLTKEENVLFDVPRFDAKLTLANGTGRQIDGVNRARETNQIVAYTDVCGANTGNKFKGTDIVATSSDLPIRVGQDITLTVTEVRPDCTNTPIPKGGMVISAGGPAAWFLKENVKPGDIITARFDIKSSSGCDWNNVEQAVGGNPLLLRDGQIMVDSNFDPALSQKRHPRSALGVTADNKLMIVTVDGRQSISKGITLPDLAALMKRLGAVNAMNLDGGGSTTLSVGGLVINSPSGGEERPVADALLVFAENPAQQELPNVHVSGIGSQVNSGEPVQLYLTWGDDAQMMTPDQMDKVIWGTSRGIGFINQKGYFIPLKERKGAVEALYGRNIIKADVRVIAGKPAAINIELVADTKDASRSVVKILVLDSNDNPLSGRQVTLRITGGKLDASTGSTNEKGEFSIGATWDVSAPAKAVTATVGSVSATAALQQQPTSPESTTTPDGETK